MAVSGILFLTLFTGMCVADSTVTEKDTPSCPCVPKNLALGAAAVQSSTYENLGAERAVDGNRNSILPIGSCSHTDGDLNPWWRVDLQEEQAVTRVSITNRGDTAAERINGAEIRIGNSQENNGNSNELAATVGSIPAGETKTFEFKPIKGRYVNIVIPGRNEFLTLCEVEVFADNPTVSCPCAPKNLALGAAAVQSSTYDNLGAQKAVDGNRNSILAGGSCSHTYEDLNPWWRVDLLEEQEVTRVSITNRGDCCAVRIYRAQIRIGNSLENNGNNNALAATVDSLANGATKTFEFKPIKGRYVNIVIPGRKEYLTLCEVEVFAGSLAPGAPASPNETLTAPVFEVFGEKDKPTNTGVTKNLALGAAAVQSSTYDNLGAERAVDGKRDSNLAGGSCSHTDRDMNPWWRVDLLKEQAVTRVVITNRGDTAAVRIYGAEIRIGNSLENNGNNNALAATVESMTLGETQTFVFKPIKGQYVNIFIPVRMEYLTLCEVEVFAD